MLARRPKFAGSNCVLGPVEIVDVLQRYRIVIQILHEQIVVTVEPDILADVILLLHKGLIEVIPIEVIRPHQVVSTVRRKLGWQFQSIERRCLLDILRGEPRLGPQRPGRPGRPGPRVEIVPRLCITVKQIINGFGQSAMRFFASVLTESINCRLVVPCRCPVLDKISCQLLSASLSGPLNQGLATSGGGTFKRSLPTSGGSAPKKGLAQFHTASNGRYRNFTELHLNTYYLNKNKISYNRRNIKDNFI